MLGFINNIDFGELEPMRYYAPPASWDDQKKKDTVHNRIFSGDWLAAEKKDGFFGKFVKDDDGNMLLYTRTRGVTGNFANKIDYVPQLHEFFDFLPNGTCLLGEMYLPTQPGSKNVQTILGCLVDKARDRQEKGEKIHFYVFDCLAWNGENLINKGFAERANYVTQLGAYVNATELCPYVDFGIYYNGPELWEYLQELLADGKEGVVIMHKDGIYEPGKRPSKTTLKVKQELKQTIDCVIIGANSPTQLYNGKALETWPYWINDVTGEHLELKSHEVEYRQGATIIPVTKNFYYGWAGSLRLGLNKNGHLEYFGDLSGLTEDILEYWRDYVGKVVEVGGMMIDAESGHIRHPRFMGWRTDKKPEECTWDQVEQ